MHTPLPKTTDAFLERTVGELVAEDYRRGAVFKQHGIDFCCGGGQTVRAACTRRNVDPAVLEQALEAVGERAQGLTGRVNAWSPAFLIDYIVNEHHTYVRESLPVLLAFAQKVAHVHGAARPELVEIARIVKTLDAAMEKHLVAEEDHVFPLIKSLEEKGVATRAKRTDLFQDMKEEHEEVGALMHRLRILSENFTPPEWACATYRALYAKLEEFEADLHRHVHLENNVLFSKVVTHEPAS